MAKGRRDSGGPTLAQVAAAAEVSEMTVSRVMRGEAAVAAATRDRVLSAAREIGYVPNRIAGALASSSTNLLGIIVPSLTNQIFPEVLAGIAEVLATGHLQPVFGVTDYSREREEAIIHDMLSWRPAGLVVCGFEQTPHALSLLRATDIPLVQMMDADGASPIEYNVGISHNAAGRAMAEHLLDRGYERIGYIGSDLSRDHAGAHRLAALRARLADAGVALVEDSDSDEPAGIALGRMRTEAFVARYRDVQAIHYSNDYMATGGVMHCLTAGIAIPDSLALCGFAGLEVGEAFPAPLTTIRSPRREIGRRTARYIVDRIASGAPRKPSQDLLPFELRIGGTT